MRRRVNRSQSSPSLLIVAPVAVGSAHYSFSVFFSVIGCPPDEFMSLIVSPAAGEGRQGIG
jgi:hypothetical protein